MKMSMKMRNALPAAKFAGPGRSFPVPDKAHAVNAKARATQGVNNGTLSRAEAVKIKANADRVIKGSK